MSVETQKCEEDLGKEGGEEQTLETEATTAQTLEQIILKGVI